MSQKIEKNTKICLSPLFSKPVFPDRYNPFSSVMQLNYPGKETSSAHQGISLPETKIREVSVLPFSLNLLPKIDDAPINFWIKSADFMDKHRPCLDTVHPPEDKRNDK